MLTPVITVHQDHDDTTLGSGGQDLVSVSHLANALEGDFGNGRKPWATSPSICSSTASVTQARLDVSKTH